MDDLNSHLFFINIIEKAYEVSYLKDLIKKAKGIPIILELFSIIYRFGGMPLLDKITLQDIHDFKQRKEIFEHHHAMKVDRTKQ